MFLDLVSDNNLPVLHFGIHLLCEELDSYPGERFRLWQFRCQLGLISTTFLVATCCFFMAIADLGRATSMIDNPPLVLVFLRTNVVVNASVVIGY